VEHLQRGRLCGGGCQHRMHGGAPERLGGEH
jgi:hypothetical protein